ncbi:MAG: hypothetical protein CMA99_04455 [Euryarchaeota archaeon]|nr:hypothetical protein [Euryarchaeota archaeon]
MNNIDCEWVIFLGLSGFGFVFLFLLDCRSGTGSSDIIHVDILCRSDEFRHPIIVFIIIALSPSFWSRQTDLNN